MPDTPRTPARLLALARHNLDEAAAIRQEGLRYAKAHLAALRAAGALVAKARPDLARGTKPGMWVLLAEARPELAEWATFFSVRTSTRAAVEAGIPSRVTAEEADELLARAREFVTVVEQQIEVAR